MLSLERTLRTLSISAGASITPNSSNKMRHPNKKSSQLEINYILTVCIHTCASGEAVESNLLHRLSIEEKWTDEDSGDRGFLKNVAVSLTINSPAKSLSETRTEASLCPAVQYSIRPCCAVRLTWRSFTNIVP